jgi:hypothetical protein
VSEQDVRRVLLDACQEAHALYHYDLAQKPNGVDWGPVEMLREEMIDKLWTAIITAVPALDIKPEVA